MRTKNSRKRDYVGPEGAMKAARSSPGGPNVSLPAASLLLLAAKAVTHRHLAMRWPLPVLETWSRPKPCSSVESEPARQQASPRSACVSEKSLVDLCALMPSCRVCAIRNIRSKLVLEPLPARSSGGRCCNITAMQTAGQKISGTVNPRAWAARTVGCWIMRHLFWMCRLDEYITCARDSEAD